ncbi:MAG: zinc ABC transporter substrate-binding protein [Pseudomonadota bacterium]
MLTLAAGPGWATLSIFACEPEWAALAKAVGSSRVKVYSATTHRQDPHYVQARPSLIAKVRRADLVVCSGAELEQGWLPLVLRKARNPGILPGTKGYFEAADYVELLETPAVLDRAEGDIHARGNPHLQLDPRNILAVARALAARLTDLDAANEAIYEKHLQEFADFWNAAISRWQAAAAPLRGQRVVVHHREWIYLLTWLGMVRAEALEPKPGVPPSAGYLASLKKRLEAEPARFIIRSPLSDPRPATWLSEQTGIAVVELPQAPGGTKGANDLISWFDTVVQRLLEAPW